MPNLILDLEVNRVDLVDEGANSEAYIKLYKRKENNTIMPITEILAKMKPEHAQVIKEALEKAKTEATEQLETDLAKAKEDLQLATEEVVKMKEEVAKACGDKVKKAICLTCSEEYEGSDCPSCMAKSKDVEEVIKSLDPTVQEVFKSLKAQKEAAEDVVKQLNNQKIEEDAIAKAKELKALPAEEAALVSIVKSASPEIYEVLKAASKLIENGPVLTEVGKSVSTTANDAWGIIEKKAEEMAAIDKISVQKAIAKVIKENPTLYREYLKGGAN